VAALSTFSVGFMAFLLTRLEVWDAGSWLILLTLCAFAVGATFAGSRMLGLAARTSAEAYASGLLRRHADELGAANTALREARARAELLTRLIVHDLRAPATTVVLGLELVEEALVRLAERDPEAAEALSLAKGESRRLAGMISDLLAVDRLEEGVRAKREPLDVPALLNGVARALEPQAGRAGVRLTVAAPERLEVSLDGKLLRRMLENLAGNALRHLHPGDRLELAAEAADEGVRISVRNSGPPVPPEVLQGLFEKPSGGASGASARRSRALLLRPRRRRARRADGARRAAGLERLVRGGAGERLTPPGRRVLRVPGRRIG